MTERLNKIEMARRDNLLYECECCFNNEYLIEDMIDCDKGHQFCT